MGDAKKNNGKYEEALVWYQKFAKRLPSDMRGVDGITSCDLALEWLDSPTKHEVHINNAFNTKFNDFTPTYAKKDYRIVYFSSSRPGGEGEAVDGWTGQGFTDIYQTAQDRKGKWSTPLLTYGGVNTEANEGAPSFNKRFNSMYFTRCIVNKEVEKNGCQIHYAMRKGKGWGEPTQITLSHDSVRVGHPAMAADDVTMYFASNMPGTLGGKDIWKVVHDKTANTWSKPENLGPTINTPGDEMYPFIRKNGDLYFSSNGHIGMGGWDIFKASKKGESFGEPENMQYPINSSGDDFGITFKGDKEAGLLSSNRPGGKGGDDIYEFSVPSITIWLEGIVRDVDTKEIIPYAVVELRGSDGSIQLDTVGADAHYKFPLSEETSYDIEGRKTKYLSDYAHVTTVGVTESGPVKSDKDLELISIVVPIALPNIEYAYASYELLERSKESLMDLVETLVNHPEITIELRAHTDFRGSESNNKVLSLKRAKSVVGFLKEKGIASARLTPKGYGESSPRRVSKKIAATTGFNEGDLLTEEFLGPRSRAGDPHWEEGMQLNRRTEFFILRTDYAPKGDTHSITH
ncbi:MAG: OmpA family protein [Flavobacteriales bacterium]|nr:OmpA family protein [Flavobacteriales bacterium]